MNYFKYSSWDFFSQLTIFIPKQDDNGDGVRRQTEYGDGCEKYALENKFEVDSTHVVDWKIVI